MYVTKQFFGLLSVHIEKAVAYVAPTYLFVCVLFLQFWGILLTLTLCPLLCALSSSSIVFKIQTYYFFFAGVSFQMNGGIFMIVAKISCNPSQKETKKLPVM